MIPNTFIQQRDRDAEQYDRLVRWTQVLTKVNYGVKGSAAPVSLADFMWAPASTDGKTIAINAENIQKVFDRLGHNRGVTNLLALNYHELSHIFYSPNPAESALVTRLKYRAKQKGIPYGQLFSLCNLVEDQRIETLFATRYRQAANYFSVLLHDQIVGNAIDTVKVTVAEGTTDPAFAKRYIAKTYFLYTVGRAYLPKEMRAAARADFIAEYGKEAADEITGLIRRYCRMNLMESTAVQKRAGDVIDQLHTALLKYGVMPPKDNTGHDQDAPGQEGNPGPAEGEYESAEDKQKREENARTTDQAADAYDEADEDDAEADAGASAEPADEDDAEGEGEGAATAESEDGDADDTDAAGSDGGAAGEGDADSEADAPADADAEEGDDGSATSDSAGSSGTAPKADEFDGLTDQMERIVEELLNNQDLREQNDELTSAVDADVAASGLDWSRAQNWDRNKVPAKPEEATAKARVSQTLQRMKADTGSMWERRVDYGKRVNLIAFNEREPWETNFFDNYEEGAEDEFDMEVVILLDRSGSMSGMVRKAEAALWAIRSSFRSVGARVWGIGYSTDAEPLFTPSSRFDERQMNNYGCGGGTNPVTALKAAAEVFGRSDAHSKVLLCITDGAWDSPENADTIIRRMNDDGVSTLLAYLDWSPERPTDISTPESRHYCQIGTNVADPMDLVTLMEGFVRHRAMSR